MLRLIARHDRSMVSWLFSSHEYTNFTYELTDLSKRELTEFVHIVSGVSRDTIRNYQSEILADTELQLALAEQIKRSPPGSGIDQELHYGNRIGWYLLARVYKPVVVVEAGVDRGMGTSILAAAAVKNRSDGEKFEVHAFDKNPDAGGLISERYDDIITSQTGDSLSLLQSLDTTVDLFIYDAGADYEREMASYRLVKDRAGSEQAVILSKTSHQSTALMDFAEAIGRPYFYWHERPKNHFYAGTGFGVVTLLPRSEE